MGLIGSNGYNQRRSLSTRWHINPARLPMMSGRPQFGFLRSSWGALPACLECILRLFGRKGACSQRPKRLAVDRTHLSVRFIIDRVRANIQQARQQQYSGDHVGPNNWLTLISAVLDTADGYLSSSKDRGLDEKKRLDHLQDAAAAAAEAYGLLMQLEGADVRDLAFPLVPPLQRWFSELGVTNTSFFRAYLEANYELFPFERARFERYRDPSASLRTAIDSTTWPILRVTVPAKAFSIVPHLAIVAHEIGHALYWSATWDIRPASAVIEAAVRRIEARLGRPFDTEIQEATGRVLSNWVQEFAADAFMLALTGPAGFFSLCDFLQFFGSVGGYSRTHPSSHQRRSILFDKLSSTTAGPSYAQAFRQCTGVELTSDINSPLLQEPKSSNEIFQSSLMMGHSPEESAAIAELYEAMPAVANLLHSQAQQIVANKAKDLLYTPSRLIEDLEMHLHPMLESIPPIEKGPSLDDKTSTDLASILNVGWAVMLTKLDELKVRVSGDSDVQAQRLERLNSLLLKAVELSEARRTWSSA